MAETWAYSSNRGDTLAAEDRFWEKVSTVGDCWEWQGHRDKAGYGTFHVSKYRHGEKAHRYSYELAYGSVPEASERHDVCVLHECDNPPCVNPAHLFIGSQLENIRDRHNKGRTKATSPVINRPGDSHPRVKLKYVEVEQLRALRESGWLHRELAKHFGVSSSYVSRLLSKEYRDSQ